MHMLKRLSILTLFFTALVLAGCGSPEPDVKVETLSGDAAKGAHLRGPSGLGGGGASDSSKAAPKGGSPD